MILLTQIQIFMHFSFGNTRYRGFVQTVNFVIVLFCCATTLLKLISCSSCCFSACLFSTLSSSLTNLPAIVLNLRNAALASFLRFGWWAKRCLSSSFFMVRLYVWRWITFSFLAILLHCWITFNNNLASVG